MADFYAVKRLAGSDLGWFASLLHKFSNTNLKGINLNADVLVDSFYRDLPIIASQTGNNVKVGVTMFGPSMAPGYSGTFKVVKSGNSKNWRLNGTLVYDPREAIGRFDNLQPSDIAVFAFDGRPVPTDITLVLLAKAATDDKTLQAHFDAMIPGGTKTMMPLTPAQIATALALSGVPSDHPLSFLFDDEETVGALEDLARGGVKGLSTLRARRGGRRITRLEMEKAKRQNEQTGADGEALVNDYLASIKNVAGVSEHVWRSDQYADAPYDFECFSSSGTKGEIAFVIDAKSTRGKFEADFHMSMAEVLYASESEVPYQIYRVYELTGNGGFIRVSSDIRGFAKSLRNIQESTVPVGVTVDSFSIQVDTGGLTWGEPIAVTFSEIGDGDAPITVAPVE